MIVCNADVKLTRQAMADYLESEKQLKMAFIVMSRSCSNRELIEENKGKVQICKAYNKTVMTVYCNFNACPLLKG